MSVPDPLACEAKLGLISGDVRQIRPGREYCVTVAGIRLRFRCEEDTAMVHVYAQQRLVARVGIDRFGNQLSAVSIRAFLQQNSPLS